MRGCGVSVRLSGTSWWPGLDPVVPNQYRTVLSYHCDPLCNISNQMVVVSFRGTVPILWGMWAHEQEKDMNHMLRQKSHLCQL